MSIKDIVKGYNTVWRRQSVFKSLDLLTKYDIILKLSIDHSWCKKNVLVLCSRSVLLTKEKLNLVSLKFGDLTLVTGIE